MSTDWSSLFLLAAEVPFAVLFLRALLSYLSERDPLQRDVLLVFTPCAVLFVVDLASQFAEDTPPTWQTQVTQALLLAQPYLTVRLAARLRRVPRWLDGAVLIAYLIVAGILGFAGLPMPPALLSVAIVLFLGSEAVAAGLLLDKASRRTGANRARLTIAAGATIAFGVMILLLGVASQSSSGPALATAGRMLGLISGVGYLIAFLPPRWLRRTFSASAAQSVTERLLCAPVESPEQVWQIYAEIMRVQTGVDAVAVLMPRPDGQLAPLAFAGPPTSTPAELNGADLTKLIRAGQPARLREGDPALVAHYGNDLSDDFVTVLSMPVPPEAEGAVLLFNHHRSLFSDDDLRLLASLGGQAGILAERQAVTAAQRRMATELSASVEALTRASQAKSSFLANMSHELRTPLNAIIGFSDLMRVEEPDGDRRRVPADWVEHIHSSGRHLLGLINDILDLAKVEAGRLDLRLGPLRVDTAVAEVITGLAPLIDRKRLSVVADLAEVTALADRVRFRQIVENLLSNAIKFTPEDGRLTIVATAADMTVSITVTDTGVGIDPADHGRVFEEFQQVGEEDWRRAGTGLGLALTKRLVEAHEGEITLISALGLGSSFTVRLPAAPTIRQPDVAGAAPGDSPAAARVLLIEDDAQAAELLYTQLTHAGYRVEVAESGEAGIISAGNRPPDAVVLDVALPGIDGFEVIRQLKADARLADIPVFFATIIDERQAGLALGASDYFVKPVEQGALLGALARTIAARPQPRVLVVDHDDAVRQAIEEGLRAGGADVVACADGRDGLSLSRSGNFDLIVCDMRASELDGFSLLAAIEQDPATRDTPVLGLSAATDAADAALVATTMAGGVGWKSMAPPLNTRTTARHAAPDPSPPAGPAPASPKDDK